MENITIKVDFSDLEKKMVAEMSKAFNIDEDMIVKLAVMSLYREYQCVKKTEEAK